MLTAAVALLPLVYLVIRSSDAGLERAWAELWQARTGWLVVRSLGLAAAVTLSCLVIGIGLAVLTVRARLPFRRVWIVLAALPLAVPSFVAAYTWIAAAPQLAGFWGAWLVLTACSYPYVYLPVAAALAKADPAGEEVARSLGRTGLQTFATVTLRQIRPAAAAGALLVALYVLSDFGAVSLMRFDAFTRVILSSYRSSFDRVPAAVLSLLLVVITLAITVAETRTRGRAGVARVGSGVARTKAPSRLSPRATVGAIAVCAGVAAVAIGFPVASLTYWLLRGQSRATDLSRLLESAGSTLGVAALGAILTTVLAIPVGILAARHADRRWVRWIEHASYAGHALPGLVVALSLVFLGVRLVPDLYQEIPLLVLAYAVLFLPAAIGSVRASVALSSPRIEEVARSLGQGTAGVLRRVTLPLAAPGVAAGAALVMLTVMKELPATLLLRPTGMDTLATRLWQQTSVGAYAGAAPYAALLIALAAVPALLLIRPMLSGEASSTAPAVETPVLEEAGAR